jgi:hypothetical protein
VAREEYLAKSREEENRTNTIQQTGVNLLSSFMKIGNRFDDPIRNPLPARDFPLFFCVLLPGSTGRTHSLDRKTCHSQESTSHAQ